MTVANATDTLEKLLRDESEEVAHLNAILSILPASNLQTLTKEIYLNKSMVPYLLATSADRNLDHSTPNKAVDFNDLCEFCLSAGLGLGLKSNNPNSSVIRLISFGRLWTWRLYNTFDGDPINFPDSPYAKEIRRTLGPGRRIATAAITADALPWFAARTLHRYLETICVGGTPKGAIILDTGGTALRSLALNLPFLSVSQEERTLMLDFVRELLPINLPLLTFPENEPVLQQLQPLRPNE